MVQYCRKCGKQLDDNVKFCDACGFELDGELPKENRSVPIQTKTYKSAFLSKLPLVLAIISTIVCVVEGLTTPILMGEEAIMAAIVLGIIGGVVGIVLMERFDEPLIAAMEFIVTGGLIYIFIARFGDISLILFIITAVATLYFKGHHANNKKLLAVPIATIVLIFVLIMAGGALYQFSAVNSVSVGNISQNITDDGYGYYNGEINGDIRVDSNFDYLSVDVDFYDSTGKIIDSTIGWNELHPESGKTYKISAMYFGKTQPVKAELKVVDSASSTTPLYNETITILTSSGV